MASDQQAFVIDLGSWQVRAGHAGLEVPGKTLPAVVGSLLHKGLWVTEGLRGVYAGDDALARRPYVTLSNPIERGRIASWEGVQVLISAALDSMSIAPDETPVLLTDRSRDPNPDRVKLCQLLFGTFKSPAVYVANSPYLALLSTGRTTGVVLDSGHGVTQAVPVYEGHLLPHAVVQLDFGGSQVTDYLASKIGIAGDERNFYPVGADAGRQIKETLCYVAQDFDAEMQKPDPNRPKEHRMPDGQTLPLGVHGFRGPEGLFKPNLLGRNEDGVHKAIYNAVMKCDPQIQKALWANVMVAGGNTLFPGFEQRLKRELRALVPPSTPVEVITPNDRPITGWAGGSLMCSLESFRSMWLTKAEFEKSGPAIVAQKLS